MHTHYREICSHCFLSTKRCVTVSATPNFPILDPTARGGPKKGTMNRPAPELRRFSATAKAVSTLPGPSSLSSAWVRFGVLSCCHCFALPQQCFSRAPQASAHLPEVVPVSQHFVPIARTPELLTYILTITEHVRQHFIESPQPEKGKQHPLQKSGPLTLT